MDIELQSCPGCEPSMTLNIPDMGQLVESSSFVARTIDEGSDVPGNDTTDATMAVGDVFNGAIDPTGDEDWIAVELNKGELVSFTLDADFRGAEIVVYDSDGNQVAAGTSGFNSPAFTVLEATASGTYYVSVSQGANRAGGNYSMEVAPWIAPDLLDAIDWGGETVNTGGTNVINVYFAMSGETFDRITAEGFNAYEMGQFQLAFDLISSIVGLSFNIVTSSAQADFVLVGDDGGESDGFYGYFNPPGQPNEGVGVFNTGAWDRVTGGNLEYGGFGFVTIMHELGHGLGLAHPHDNGGGSPVIEGVTTSTGSYGIYDLNQGVYTMMTYNDGAPAYVPPSSDLWGYQATMMALDIALLQEKYGANMDTATGDDVYEITDLEGAGQAWACIWDVSGTDELIYNGSQIGILDLREATLQYEQDGGGYMSHVYEVSGGYTIAAGVTIENATGGSGQDWLIGNDAANVLTGRGGNDTLRSFDGDDLLIGGNGDDVFFTGRGADTVEGGNGSDTIIIKSDVESGIGWVERDKFIDFSIGEDTIDISRMDGDLSTEVDDAFDFIGTSAFSGSGVGEVRTIDEGDYIVVRMDIDGDGLNDLELQVYTPGTLTESDFLL